ncbi:putative Mediator of RNA polymerase II transcription subunit 5 [Glarea lozoyensis 74030]|uniref:Mediator of RNA polymerase II transcription subunit 5 n=1 Tax=Glarea lozoyensis (strain ATCC 74030 / MF5533) TaxID=1104152 RepID=H0EY00_GLAL7|nr:putative Mediator of RNA polymerase II transcription subunit 5 [Glarea lozoyensis 74030]
MVAFAGLVSRLDNDTFTSYIPILLSQHPLPPSRIAEIFLEPNDSRILAPDPRVPRYIQILLTLGTVNAPAILRALLRYSTAGASAQDGQLEDGKAKEGRWGNSYATEEMLFYRIAKFVSSGFAPKGNVEAGELLLVLVKWMETSLSAYHAAQGMLELGGMMEELTAQIMALGTLAIAVLENDGVMNVIAKGRGARGKDLNATSRNERGQTITIIRSFLINKIPLLLTTLSSTLFPPLTAEYCITEALNRVDTNAFPTLSNMFDESSNNNMFSDSVRQDFCFACCLHGLIEESSIETLLGDIPMQSLPAGGRYVKQDLVQQCLSDPGRAEALISELGNMDGNVGAVSQAITETPSSPNFLTKVTSPEPWTTSPPKNPPTSTVGSAASSTTNPAV